MGKETPVIGKEDDEAGASRPLNLRQIEVFRAIMTAGSISGAGRMLHVSQPAVSSVLALTERRLGFLLFERVRSRLLPTPEARRLFAEIESVYDGIQRVNDLAASLAHTGSGTLKVVSSASFGQRMMPQALTRLQARNPQARVDYRSVTFDSLAAHFHAGHAHLGISMVAPAHPNLDSIELGTADLVCVMPRQHPLAAQPCIRPQDFAAHRWIGYPQGSPLASASSAFFGTADAGTATVEVHSPVTACAFVSQGMGLALIDAWCVTPDMQASVAVRPITPAARVGIWATYSNLEPLPLLARRLLAALKQVIEDHAPQPGS
jgi:DNA-binding transcriptional LysR family regulator